MRVEFAFALQVAKLSISAANGQLQVLSASGAAAASQACAPRAKKNGQETNLQPRVAPQIVSHASQISTDRQTARVVPASEMLLLIKRLPSLISRTRSQAAGYRAER